ncbi:MAG: 30S ribosome-binding factor RbfA [Candidatus Omnitrophica bacterium]|nr:30S ribosome-binding factor RbfA [Candidatus Omnitrophota bacterium]MDD5026881.1 30S ribosome-binding factor RbfA [Candidatus Omnitrophota bacterium]MDD5662517.1 30S ribosome-binding factor RbfA [Candidatus Omnitrophota bacterium]
MSRQDKVAEAIRQEASVIIHDKLKDPRLGFVTIMNVEVTQDLRYAKIFFSVLGNDDAHKNTKEALDSALGFVRKLIAQRLNLRFAPEIAFYEDRSSEYSVRIEEVLNEIKEIDEQNKPKKSRRRNKKA